MAIEMLSIEIPQNLLGQPEKFEFLGVGATPRFPSYRSIQTPLKKTSGQLKSVNTSSAALSKHHAHEHLENRTLYRQHTSLGSRSS